MHTSADEVARRFRALHEGDRAFVIPNPWDRGSARMLQALGFQALATTSAGFAFARGVHDGAVERGDMLAHCREMVDACTVPVSADLEKGFGDDPASVARTIREAAGTGLAGCSIEDFSGDDASPIYALELAVERVQAAVEAARGLGRDFVLTARAENHIRGRPDLDDTITRLRAFEAAGADVLYAPGLRTLEDIATVCRSVTRPVNVIMGIAGVGLTLEQLSEVGVRRVSVGSGLMRLAYGRMLAAAEAMLENGSFDFGGEAAPFTRFEQLLG